MVLSSSDVKIIARPPASDGDDRDLVAVLDGRPHALQRFDGFVVHR